MITIRTAGKEDLSTVQKIAFQTYGPTYTAILGPDQVDYMLKKFYSKKALSEQFDQGHVFLIANNLGMDVGFASYSLTDAKGKIFHLQKLYVLPGIQGSRNGISLLNAVIARVSQQGGKVLQLNVNRLNNAKTFYEKMGFAVSHTVDLPIGKGYFMNDYVMALEIKNAP